MGDYYFHHIYCICCRLKMIKSADVNHHRDLDLASCQLLAWLRSWVHPHDCLVQIGEGSSIQVCLCCRMCANQSTVDTTQLENHINRRQRNLRYLLLDPSFFNKLCYCISFQNKTNITLNRRNTSVFTYIGISSLGTPQLDEWYPAWMLNMDETLVSGEYFCLSRTRRVVVCCILSLSNTSCIRWVSAMVYKCFCTVLM